MNPSATTREGLLVETQDRLLEIITPGWRENPWPANSQARNQLVVRMLLDLSLIPKEIVYLHMEEIDCEDNKLLVAASQPRMRVLWFTEHLGVLIRDYITHTRDSFREAEKHPFLFVSTRSGQPMSLSDVEEIFSSLKKLPDMPKDLSPQVLRQTWNSNFSEWCKTNAVPHQEEIELRECITGEGDRTAETVRWREVRLRKPTILEVLAGPENNVLYVDISHKP